MDGLGRLENSIIQKTTMFLEIQAFPVYQKLQPNYSLLLIMMTGQMNWLWTMHIQILKKYILVQIVKCLFVISQLMECLNFNRSLLENTVVELVQTVEMMDG